MISKNLKRKSPYPHEESDVPSRKLQPKLKSPKTNYLFIIPKAHTHYIDHKKYSSLEEYAFYDEEIVSVEVKKKNIIIPKLFQQKTLRIFLKNLTEFDFVDHLLDEEDQDMNQNLVKLPVKELMELKVAKENLILFIYLISVYLINLNM